jgi:hypothetical protein
MPLTADGKSILIFVTIATIQQFDRWQW